MNGSATFSYTSTSSVTLIKIQVFQPRRDSNFRLLWRCRSSWSTTWPSAKFTKSRKSGAPRCTCCQHGVSRRTLVHVDGQHTFFKAKDTLVDSREMTKTLATFLTCLDWFPTSLMKLMEPGNKCLCISVLNYSHCFFNLLSKHKCKRCIGNDKWQFFFSWTRWELPPTSSWWRMGRTSPSPWCCSFSWGSWSIDHGEHSFHGANPCIGSKAHYDKLPWVPCCKQLWQLLDQSQRLTFKTATDFSPDAARPHITLMSHCNKFFVLDRTGAAKANFGFSFCLGHCLVSELLAEVGHHVPLLGCHFHGEGRLGCQTGIKDGCPAWENPSVTYPLIPPDCHENTCSSLWQMTRILFTTSL